MFKPGWYILNPDEKVRLKVYQSIFVGIMSLIDAEDHLYSQFEIDRFKQPTYVNESFNERSFVPIEGTTYGFPIGCLIPYRNKIIDEIEELLNE